MCLYSNYYTLCDYYTTGSSDVHSNNSIPLVVVSSHSETNQITTGILIQSTILICVLTNSLYFQGHHTHQG